MRTFLLAAFVCALIFSQIQNSFSQFNTYPYAANKADDKFNAEQRRKDIARNQEKPIKAVLVVGPVEEDTQKFIFRMQKTESFLRDKFVEVHAFYYPNSDWDKIKKAAEGASIFIYSGHGSGEGIKPKEHVSNEEIRKDIKLRKNALVIFNHVCFGAGSSASDNEDIGLEEAENRVTEYAETFFKVGAGCYYANNWDNAALEFLQNFYAEKTLKQCYELAVGYFNKIEKVDLCAFDNKLKIGISSTGNGLSSIRYTHFQGVRIKEEKVPAKKDYNIAFVSGMDYCLKDLLAK